MGETLFNWALLLSSFAVLVGIAWVGFRDLRAIGAPSRAAAPVQPFDRYAADSGPAPADDARHVLRVDYSRNGAPERTQFVTDAQPGYVGTEFVPGMGAGILVRHVRLYFEEEGFALQNRHGTRTLPWRADNGRSGELAPGESMAVGGEIDLVLGDWKVTCREES